MSHLKKIISFLIYLLLGLGFFYFIYKKTQVKATLDFDLSQLKLSWLALTILLLTIDTFLRAFRISFMYPTKKEDNPKKFWIVYSSIPLSIIIGGGGVFTRMLLLKKRLNISYLISVVNVALEKLFDLTVIVIAIVITIYSVPDLKEKFIDRLNLNAYLSQIIFISIGLSIIILVIFKAKVVYFSFYLINKFNFSKINSNKWRWWLKKRVFILFKASNFFHHPKKTLFFLIFSLFIWTTEITIIYTIFMSMGYFPSFFQAFFINTINLLFFLLPLSPSGLGVVQASFLISGELLNLPYNMLVTSISYHSLLLFANGLFIILGLYKANLNLGQIKKIFLKKAKK